MTEEMQQEIGMHPQSILVELGLFVEQEGVPLVGHGDVFAEICVPDAVNPDEAVLRSGVIAAWADLVTGTVAAESMDPRIALTLDLEVQVLTPATVGSRVLVEAAPVKVGRSVTVCRADFRDEASGTAVAVAYGSFMASPDPGHVWDEGFSRMQLDGRLPVPLAERMQLRWPAPGVVELPKLPHGCNASGAIQGGLVAVAVEEAARSIADVDSTIGMLNLRYLRPFSIGPARARATRDGHLVLVELEDAGAGKLGAVATVRLDDRVRLPIDQYA
jgi:acyl-coenzyme A thioesterase PaaI-like protein